MKVIAAILSFVGFVYFVRLVNFLFQIVPMHVYGVEGGMIETGIDVVFGGIASALALVFATIHSARAAKTKNAYALLVWCRSLFFGFCGLVLYELFTSTK